MSVLPFSDFVAGPAWRGVRVFSTVRAGGVSTPPYDSLNLGDHVGDEREAVAENRRRLAAGLPDQPRWLSQVHGVAVHDADAAATSSMPPVADAAATRTPGRVLAILSADCLPVAVASADGRALALAHAGWRGLAAGVLESAVAAVRERAPEQALMAWLGPCIGPQAFEVGADVLQVFGDHAPANAFVARAGVAGKWWCDLPLLARYRLCAAGVENVETSGLCTVRDSRFYSYRREGLTGRFATLAWLEATEASPN